MSASLVGSEMCIRDRRCTRPLSLLCHTVHGATPQLVPLRVWEFHETSPCLLYTSDAADDM
eukprot:3176004-Alexandrium_andersonii.AAC.1